MGKLAMQVTKQRTLLTRTLMGRGMQAYVQGRVQTWYTLRQPGGVQAGQYKACRTVLAQPVSVFCGPGLAVRIVAYPPPGIAYLAANAYYRPAK